VKGDIDSKKNMLSCQMTMMNPETMMMSILQIIGDIDENKWRRINVVKRPKTKIMSGLAKSPDRVASLYAHPPRLLATS